MVLLLHCVPCKPACDFIAPCKATWKPGLGCCHVWSIKHYFSTLSLPQSCPSSLPHQLPPCKVLLHVKALVFISTSWFGSGVLILAAWAFLVWGSTALLPPALHWHLLTAFLFLLLLWNPCSAQLCPQSGCPHPVTQLLLPSAPHISDLCLSPSLVPSLQTCILLSSSGIYSHHSSLLLPFASHVHHSCPSSLADTLQMGEAEISSTFSSGAPYFPGLYVLPPCPHSLRSPCHAGAGVLCACFPFLIL